MSGPSLQPDDLALRVEVAAKANIVAPTLTTDFASVRAHIEANAVVWTCWQDAQEPGGVGLLLIKGQGALREIIASGQSQALSWTAIPCFCAEQAYALQQASGEPDRRH